jgi:hypothetical protein
MVRIMIVQVRPLFPMTTMKTKIWLTALSIVVLGLCWRVYSISRDQRVLGAFVQDLTTQADVFELYRISGLRGATPSVTASCLKNIVEFQYPAEAAGSVGQPGSVGSKHFASAPHSTQYYVTQLKRMVERERTAAVGDLITFLRTKTGRDLGDDPQKWTQEYSRKK